MPSPNLAVWGILRGLKGFACVCINSGVRRVVRAFRWRLEGIRGFWVWLPDWLRRLAGAIAARANLQPLPMIIGNSRWSIIIGSGWNPLWVRLYRCYRWYRWFQHLLADSHASCHPSTQRLSPLPLIFSLFSNILFIIGIIGITGNGYTG